MRSKGCREMLNNEGERPRFGELIGCAKITRKRSGAALRQVHHRCIVEVGHETRNLSLVFATLRFPLFSQSADFRLAPIQLFSAGSQPCGLLVDLNLPPLHAKLKLRALVLDLLPLSTEPTQSAGISSFCRT